MMCKSGTLPFLPACFLATPLDAIRGCFQWEFASKSGRKVTFPTPCNHLINCTLTANSASGLYDGGGASGCTLINCTLKPLPSGWILNTVPWTLPTL